MASVCCGQIPVFGPSFPKITDCSLGESGLPSYPTYGVETLVQALQRTERQTEIDFRMETTDAVVFEPLLNFEWVTLNQIEHRDEEQR